MKTRIFTLAGVLALGGCSLEDTAAIQLFQVCANVVPDGATGACTYSNKCDKVLGGTFCADVTSAITEATAIVQVNNQLANNRDSSSGRANTNDFI
ncbi:MAG TPA: hypothetical protein VIV59_01920, partial [Anaeromyxobacteraceae bacterium]